MDKTFKLFDFFYPIGYLLSRKFYVFTIPFERRKTLAIAVE